jgi:hypothetical protein
MAGATARIVAALAQNIEEFADVREVGHQLPARQRRRQATVVDAAGERSGGNIWRHYVPGDAIRASDAVQELRKDTVQTT